MKKFGLDFIMARGVGVISLSTRLKSKVKKSAKVENLELKDNKKF